jgi:prolyl 4-hydroxylase
MVQMASERSAPDFAKVAAWDAIDQSAGSAPLARQWAYLKAIGFGTLADPIAAMEHRLARADADDQMAMAEIGLIHQMAGDTNAGRRWLDKAEALGSIHALAALCRMAIIDETVSAHIKARSSRLAQAQHPFADILSKGLVDLPVCEHAAKPPKRTNSGALVTALLSPSGASANLSQAPRIAGFEQIVPVEVAEYLAAGSMPFLQPASIFDPGTGQTIQDPYRRSLVATLPESAMDIVLWAVKWRMAWMAGCTYEQGEPLTVLVYRPGDEYKAHFDFLVEDGAIASADLAARGQRIATSLIKIVDTHVGGETIFPRLSLSWNGRSGDGVAFDNVDNGGAGDPKTLHHGATVTEGLKILTSLWLRER